jgi:hypothetical protein
MTMTRILMGLSSQIETRATRMTMDQDPIQTPPVEYTPQWLEPEPEPEPKRQEQWLPAQPRFQFEERSSNFFDNKILIGIAIGVIVMGVLMTMRPMVIHGK